MIITLLRINTVFVTVDITLYNSMDLLSFG